MGGASSIMGEIHMKILFLLVLLLFNTKIFAGEWNDKPVMCAEEQEVMYAIQEKKETLLFKSVQLTKVRSKEGLQKRIVTLPLQIYVNFDTKTFTIVEYHDEHKVYCIISYGTELTLIQNL